ncbi:hypothetical protein B0H10DRAFT_1996818 [Mycena sp. CBHHK59/15]|nr:hypothetical protein B0H10DRAFT_1996818 [Mycena sp. CBHHK59/15]
MSLFSVDDTLGAAFIGFAFSCVVFGVNTNQVVTYFHRYPEDKLPYKFLVACIWYASHDLNDLVSALTSFAPSRALEVVDQVFIGHSIYFYTITHFANPLIMIEEPVIWSLIAQLTVGAIVGTIVRLCFAMRVWRFSQRNITVTSAVVALTLAELGLAISMLCVS